MLIYNDHQLVYNNLFSLVPKAVVRDGFDCISEVFYNYICTSKQALTGHIFQIIIIIIMMMYEFSH